MTGASLGLASLPGRCFKGYAPIQHPAFCQCSAQAPAVAPEAEWPVFVAALRSAVRPDGTVHACDVRPLVRDRIPHKRIGQAWRRARNERLLVEVGHERSDDAAGRNAGRLEPYYAMRGAA